MKNITPDVLHEKNQGNLSTRRWGRIYRTTSACTNINIVREFIVMTLEKSFKFNKLRQNLRNMHTRCRPCIPTPSFYRTSRRATPYPHPNGGISSPIDADSDVCTDKNSTSPGCLEPMQFLYDSWVSQQRQLAGSAHITLGRQKESKGCEQQTFPVWYAALFAFDTYAADLRMYAVEVLENGGNNAARRNMSMVCAAVQWVKYVVCCCESFDLRNCDGGWFKFHNETCDLWGLYIVSWNMFCAFRSIAKQQMYIYDRLVDPKDSKG